MLIISIIISSSRIMIVIIIITITPRSAWWSARGRNLTGPRQSGRQVDM